MHNTIKDAKMMTRKTSGASLLRTRVSSLMSAQTRARPQIEMPAVSIVISPSLAKPAAMTLLNRVNDQLMA